jgi:hypothetical protein
MPINLLPSNDENMGERGFRRRKQILWIEPFFFGFLNVYAGKCPYTREWICFATSRDGRN